MVELALADPDASVESLRAVCGRVLAAGADQERLIEALLTLARSERSVERRERFDLADVVAATLADARTEGVAVTRSLDAAPISGDRRLAERLVCNLLDNAVRYNQPNGWVHITTCTDAGRARLAVSKRGPPVAPGEETELLEPFRRAAPERCSHGTGHGLGLSIAAAIAAAHDAELTVHALDQGGLDIEASFPASEPATDRRALESARAGQSTSRIRPATRAGR